VIEHEIYMRRCIELAALGAGNVAPNPMVGAVLVNNNNIIGEGYHEEFGEAHAEVNCINSVKECERQLIKECTLYVSLEPCAHFGKTPPCADLIIKHHIKHVVIGCTDSYEKVNGAGIKKLQAAGIKVDVGILESECRILNKRFFMFHTKKRPYVILKWAQSKDGFIAGEDLLKTKISNTYTDRLVHKWRSQEAAILVGYNTIKTDNPHLSTRNWTGKNPVRIIIDESNKLAKNANIFNLDADTIIFNRKLSTVKNNVEFYKIDDEKTSIDAVMECLHSRQINSVIIEGGTKTLQLYINAGLWDEARVITNTVLFLNKGINAPLLHHQNLESSHDILNDRIDYFLNNNNDSL